MSGFKVKPRPFPPVEIVIESQERLTDLRKMLEAVSGGFNFEDLWYFKGLATGLLNILPEE